MVAARVRSCSVGSLPFSNHGKNVPVKKPRDNPAQRGQVGFDFRGLHPLGKLALLHASDQVLVGPGKPDKPIHGQRRGGGHAEVERASG